MRCPKCKAKVVIPKSSTAGESSAKAKPGKPKDSAPKEESPDRGAPKPPPLPKPSAKPAAASSARSVARPKNGADGKANTEKRALAASPPKLPHKNAAAPSLDKPSTVPPLKKTKTAPKDEPPPDGLSELEARPAPKPSLNDKLSHTSNDPAAEKTATKETPEKAERAAPVAKPDPEPKAKKKATRRRQRWLTGSPADDASEKPPAEFAENVAAKEPDARARPAPADEKADPKSREQKPPGRTPKTVEKEPDASASPGETEPREEPERPTQGIRHKPSRRRTVYYLGLALALTAVFSVVPAVLDVVAHFRAFDSPGIQRWAQLLLLIGVLELAYAVYLVQLPDWSTVWVVAVFGVLVSCLFAVGIGVSMFPGRQSEIVAFLDIADKQSQAAAWCVCAMSITLLVTYFLGRCSLRWRKTDEGHATVGHIRR